MSSRSASHLGRVRVPDGSRLVWYGEAGDHDFWLRYWAGKVTPRYYAAARERDLATDPLGRLLITFLDPAGLHLEAGCGAGKWVAALAAKGYRVEGIESSSALVDLIRSVEPSLPIRHGDALAIDRPGCHYDSYLSFGVVEHRREGPDPFFGEAHRVLRPGGVIVVSVPFFGPVRRGKARVGLYADRHLDLPFYQYGFSLAELRRLVAAAGFEVMAARPLEPHRMLLEESAAYARLADGRWGRWARRFVDTALGRVDGHMAVVVGRKLDPPT